MSKFKVGDKVRKVDGEAFSNGDEVLTVMSVEEDRVWLQETQTHIWKHKIKHDFVSPIKTKTIEVKELVTGEYGNLTIYEIGPEKLRIEFNKSEHSSSELRDAAKILVEIADFIDEKEFGF